MVEAIISLIDKRILLKTNEITKIYIINPAWAYSRSALCTATISKNYANLWAKMCVEGIKDECSVHKFASNYIKDILEKTYMVYGRMNEMKKLRNKTKKLEL